ncbi:MAG: zinc ribbon domain-containing protein [Gammaproteobacteria bacterium]|jgi:putative FmdB family regulatory protein|nr:zinc ribbon domain-containing protein [Gammaproteobacteria bacterium]
MPVYEFYCPDCHAIYNFFSRKVDTETLPACPDCGRSPLERQASPFAISKGRGDEESDDEGLPAGMDEEKMMRALASMEGELEGLDEDDPKQAAQMMRRLFDATGLKMGDGMAEAMRRMESGEDPDAIEAEMGDVLENEDPFALSAKGGGKLPSLKDLRRDLLPPRRVDDWYPLKRD